MCPKYAGIDTSKTLLEAMRKEEEERRKMLSRRVKGPFIIEPLLALTETLTQQSVSSCLQKWDVARQFFLGGKLAVQQRAVK